MDAPPEKGEDTRPFEMVTRWLRGHGYSAPEVIAWDETEGFLLLEDLGDTLYSNFLSDNPDAGSETALYRAAVKVLVSLARHNVPDWLQGYNAEVLDREARLFVEWWLPAATGQKVETDLIDEYSALVADATRAVEPVREVTVLRDYHAENLIWLPDREDEARVGLLDYQDALAGHPAYDLVSLLEDARRDTSADLQETMLQFYLAERPELEETRFRADYAALGAQRNLKIIGIFTRLAVRDRKSRYLALIPRVWRHLMHDLSHPDLLALANWVEQHSPEPSDRVLAQIEQQSTR